MRDIFKEKYFGGNTMKLGVKDKNVHFCTFRNQANFTRAGINGLSVRICDSASGKGVKLM